METKPKVVADQPGTIVEEARTLLESVASLRVPRSYDLQELKSLLTDAKGVFSWGNVKLVDGLLKEAPQLRVIGVVGVGCDHVDLISATRNGIVVANAPGSNAEAVAEFALLLILALARYLIPAQATIRAKRWVLAEEFTGLELKGASLGLVGLGYIGRRVGELARNFDMAVFAYDPYVSKESVEKMGITLTDLHTAVSRADVVSIHVPLSAETKGLIGEKEIDLMKPGAILVNTARAPVVDEQALYNALRSGHLSAAATDVFPKEPPDLSPPLYDLPNFYATPHIAAMTWSALKQMQLEAARGIVTVLRGERPRSVVNRGVLKGGG